jgi:DNA mismatch endonuclease, patch repair protein
MARVKGRGNKSTEIEMARALRRERVHGWRRHLKGLPGRPDFFFTRERVAVFVDGCFWHGCNRCLRLPKGNRAYWVEKIAGNQRRDARTRRQLQQRGIATVRVWEHKLRDATWISRLKRLLAGRQSN